MPFHFCVYCEVSKLGVLYPELAFDCVLIACSLESIRPGLVQGCNLQGPQWCGLGLLDTLFRVMPAPLSMVCMP